MRLHLEAEVYLDIKRIERAALACVRFKFINDQSLLIPSATL